MNHLNLIIRNFRKNKFLLSSNIFSMIIGVTGLLFLGVYIIDELSYDKFHNNGNRIYRLTRQSKKTGENNIIFPAVRFEEIKNMFPEFQSGFRLYKQEDQNILLNNKKYLSNVTFADNEIFQIMTFPLLIGNKNNVLNSPFSVAVSESFAKKYYGRINVINNSFIINGNTFNITAVFKDIPDNSHIKADIIAALNSYKKINSFFWTSPQYSSCNYYFLVKEGVNIKRTLGKVTKKFSNKFNHISMMPLKDIYFHSNVENWNFGEEGDITLVNIFTGVAILILLTALFNYQNMLNLLIRLRHKELVIKKILGAGNKIYSLILKEIAVKNLIIVFGSVVMIILFLNQFNDLVDKKYTLISLLIIPNLILFISIFVFLTLGAFVLQAGYLYRIKTNTLNENINADFSNNIKIKKRNVILGFQFVVAIGVLSGLFIIKEQMDFIRNSKMGYDREKVIVINNNGTTNRIEVLKNELKKYPYFKSVSSITNIPGEDVSNYSHFTLSDKKDTVQAGLVGVSEDLFSTLGTKILKGKVDENFLNSRGIIINKAFADKIIEKDIIGKKISGCMWLDGDVYISGIVENIYNKSFREEIEPVTYVKVPWSVNNILIKYSGNNVNEILNRLKKEWNRIIPEYEMSFTFLDEKFNDLYKKEIRAEKLLNVFAVVAIIITILGLINIVKLVCDLKRKEIGIRKVLGAENKNLLYLLIKDYLFIIIGSALISIIIVHSLMNDWLSEFIYKIDLKPVYYVFPVVIVTLISICIIIINALKTIRINPITSIHQN